MNETLKHVQKRNKYTTQHNPPGYLSWPLLRYDYLVMHALPPDQYEEDCTFINIILYMQNMFNYY